MTEPGPLSSSEIGVAVVGLGRMGTRRIEALEGIPGVRLRIVLDVDQEKARAVGTERGCDWAKGPAELLRRSDVGLVIVCVPNADHAAIVLEALRAKKHVLCEKPLSVASASCRTMAAAAEANGVQLKVGSNHRYFPNVQRAVEIVRAGGIGRPLVFRGWIGHDGSGLAGTWFTRREQSGGGTLLDNGVHLLDIARWIMGDVRDCVAQIPSVLRKENAVEDYATATYTTRDGGVVSVASSWFDWHGYSYFEIIGDAGYLLVDSRGKNVLEHGTRAPGMPTVFDFSKVPPRSYRDELEDLLRAIRTGRSVGPDGRDGEYVLRMVEAAYSSAESGTRTEL